MQHKFRAEIHVGVAHNEFGLITCIAILRNLHKLYRMHIQLFQQLFPPDSLNQELWFILVFIFHFDLVNNGLICNTLCVNSFDGWWCKMIFVLSPGGSNLPDFIYQWLRTLMPISCGWKLYWAEGESFLVFMTIYIFLNGFERWCCSVGRRKWERTLKLLANRWDRSHHLKELTQLAF